MYETVETAGYVNYSMYVTYNENLRVKIYSLFTYTTRPYMWVCAIKIRLGALICNFI